MRYIILKNILLELSKFSLNFQQKNINYKKDKSPVTELDIINQYVCEFIIQYYFRNDNIISEEDLYSEFAIKTIKLYDNDIKEILTKLKNISTQQNNIDSFTWFIDPIDGTKGFIDNLAFSIAISVVQDNNLICSGLTSIGMNKTFDVLPKIIIATTDNSKVEVFDENSKSIYINKINSDKIIAISRKHKTNNLYIKLNKLGYKTIEMDSQAKYMLVLLNLAQYYIREAGSCGNKKEYSWDHLAGIHLIRVKGGYCYDIDRNSPIFSDKTKYIHFKEYLISLNTDSINDNILNDLKEMKK